MVRALSGSGLGRVGVRAGVGELVAVGRPAAEVAARLQHLVTLVTVEDDGATGDLSVIWEVEPGATDHSVGGAPKP